MATQIVSWTTPYQRGDAAWRAAAELLEFKKTDEALDQLREHQNYLNRLLEFILAGGLEVRYGDPDAEERRERAARFDAAAGGRCSECGYFGGSHDMECVLR